MKNTPKTLTSHERRILAEIESGLRRNDPDLDRTLAGKRWRTWTSVHLIPVSAWVLLTALGIVLVARGLVIQSVLWAFAGHVLTVIGVYQATMHPRATRIVPWARRFVGLETADQDETPRP
jgi:hypothetical protein